jgi:hypothetical protein
MAAVTRRFVEKQAERLLRQTPSLAELRWRAHTLSDAPLEDVCALIQDAWQRVYGNRIRIAFTPALLRYAAACSEEPGVVTTVEDGEGLCGVMLGLPMEWETGADHGPITLSTGLCMAARHEGGHLVELLLAKHGLNLIEAGHAFNFHWRATASDREETGGKGLMHVRRIPLYAKPLRCATAARLGNLPLWKGMGLRWLALRHRSGRALPASLSMNLFAPEDAHECAAFLTAQQPPNGIRRRFSPAPLTRRCTFDEDGIRAAGLVFREAGRIVGMTWGYVNPVSDTDAYWALDGSVFHTELSAARRAACLSAMEGHARDALGCFAVMTPGSVCGEPLDRLGYIAVRHYHVGAVAYQEVPALTRENIGGAFLELR